MRDRIMRISHLRKSFFTECVEFRNRGFVSKKRYYIMENENTKDNSIKAFVQAMNKKANEFGMHNSVFCSPAGDSNNNLSCVKDIMYLAYYANNNDVIRNIWGKQRKTINVVNVKTKKRRSIKLYSTVNAKYFDKEFELLGSKTGQWGNSRSLLCVFLYEGSIIFGAVSGIKTDEDRFIAMKQLLHTVKQYATGRGG